jgi:DNA-binding PucR family transcriptional regulator
MKITVQEAMDLKKEVLLKVNQAQRELSLAQTTVNIQDGVEMNTPTKTFGDHFKNLVKLLDISREINDVLARFNTQHGVDSLVRQKKNWTVIKDQLQAAINRTKPSVINQFITVGNERVAVQTIVKEIVDVKELETRLREVKKTITKIQTQIFQANTQEIELSFEESDF